MLIMAVGLTQKAGVATVTGNARRDGDPMPAPLQFEALLAAFHTRGEPARRTARQEHAVLQSGMPRTTIPSLTSSG